MNTQKCFTKFKNLRLLSKNATMRTFLVICIGKYPKRDFQKSFAHFSQHWEPKCILFMFWDKVLVVSTQFPSHGMGYVGILRLSWPERGQNNDRYWCHSSGIAGFSLHKWVCYYGRLVEFF